MIETLKSLEEMSEEEILKVFMQEIIDGKRSMWPQWLPEIGEEIELDDFHYQVEIDEIEGARVILGHFPHAAGGDPYDPRDKYAWGVRVADHKIVYTIIPFSPEILKGVENNLQETTQTGNNIDE